MKKYQKYFKKILRSIISGKFRYLLLSTIGLNNYFSLIIRAMDQRGNQRANKNILCIERSLFEKDIDELSYRIRKYGWIWLRKSQINVYQENLLPRSHMVQTLYQKKIEEAPDKWKECIRRSKMLMKRLKIEKNVSALMVGNLDYWQDYSLQVACKELGIPIFILQKEYVYNEEGVKVELEYYKKTKFKPTADAIMVFGKKMKDGYEKLKNFDSARIFVTGSPRIDRWRSIENTSGSTYEGLVIISFMFRTYDEIFLNMLHKISQHFKIKNLGKITVKSREYFDHKIILDFCKNHKITNIEVIQYISIHDLVSNCKAVISLNSMATIESMISLKPIIVPNWLTKNSSQKLFDQNDELSKTAVRLCNKEQDLLDNINEIFENKNFSISDECVEARIKFIKNYWDYDENNTASSKVQKVIDDTIEKISQRN